MAMIKKHKKNKDEATTTALMECLKQALGNMLGHGEDSEELARMIIAEWQCQEFSPRLIQQWKLVTKGKSKAQRKQAETTFVRIMDRHDQLSYFTERVCWSFSSDRNIGFSYDRIVRAVNRVALEQGEIDPILEYPTVGKGMESSQVEEIKKKRLEVEDLIKLWYRQLIHPDQQRLHQFTNDEAWLNVLNTWNWREDRPIPVKDCLITPSNVPDCYWKFKHMKELQKDNWWGSNKKHLIEYVPLLQDWPSDYWKFSYALVRIEDEEERRRRRGRFGFGSRLCTNQYYGTLRSSYLSPIHSPRPSYNDSPSRSRSPPSYDHSNQSDQEDDDDNNDWAQSNAVWRQTYL